MHGLRFALRSLAKSPGFTLATVSTLALGIGASAAIFSVADRVLFRAPPYPAPEQLAILGFKTPQIDFVRGQLPIQVAAYRERTHLFSALAALEPSNPNVVADGVPFGASLGRVSLDYFPTLGVTPLLGRVFVPGEDQAGADDVVVLGHRLWRERFGGDPAVLGRTVAVAGQSCRVVGVLSPDFRPPPMHAAELYRPLVMTIDPARPFGSFLFVLARLRPGVTTAQAEAEMAAVTLPINAAAARRLADRKPRVALLTEELRQWTPKTHATLLGAVGMLYAIACANAVNLMLARLHARRKELSVRLALGCSRGQLVRLLLLENLGLAALAGAAGLLVAQWVFPVLLRLAPAGSAQLFGDVHLEWRALGFTAALCAFTGLLVSLVPAWRIAQANLIDGLKESGQAQGEGRRLRRVRNGLVVLEAALAVVLLVGTGLMVRTVQRLQHIERGFDPTNKVAVWLQLPGTPVSNPYSAPDARRNFYLQLEERLRAIPGVTGIAMTSTVPLAGTSGGFLKKPDGTEVQVGFNPATPGYRRMLGLPLRRGRWFDDAVPGGGAVVVLNETMAREFFGTADALGRTFSPESGPRAVPWQVVGIVADVREQPRAKPRPQFYYPYWQRTSQGVVSVLFSLSRPADVTFADAVRRAVFAVDPLVAVMSPRPLADAAAAQVAQERYALTVLQVLSALALGLAVLGLFAVMAFTVAQRLGEFGVRLALGATPERLFRLVLAHGLTLAIAGVVLGSGVAWALTRFLQSLLYETSGHEPLVYAGVSLLLLAAAALGCWLPARRATRVDVAKLLRAE